MKLRSITECHDLKGRYVIVRGSVNLPLGKDGRPSDTFRLKRLIPTLTYLKENGAKTILIGHIGRELTDSLVPVFEELKTSIPVTWGGPILSSEFHEAREIMQDGDILMAENLRQDEREKANDPEFGTALAALGDCYVDDAFGNAHREHASMVGIPKHLPSYAGLNLIQEVTELTKVMDPEEPSLFMLGGAKFETKLPLIEKYLKLYDQVFVGGALANDIFKAKGLPVGTSLLSDITLDPALVEHPKLLLPVDVTVESVRGQRVCLPHEVMEDECIKDAGPATVTMLAPYIDNAKTVLWNGPLGEFEGGYKAITEAVAKRVAGSNAHSVVGGGDTIAAIERLCINQDLGWISTGGGAMLSFLEHGTTAAINLLREPHE